MRRKVPNFHTDCEAAALLDQDLSDLDVSQLEPVSFELAAKCAQVDLRVPQPLLDAVKARARAETSGDAP